MKSRRHDMICLGILLAAGQVAMAQVADEVGYTALVERVGAANAPDGSGVVVAQTEAFPSGTTNYAPDASNSQFTGKTFILRSGASDDSSHATIVGWNLYGSTFSIAPGIDTIYLYSAGGWLGSNFLRENFATSTQPLTTPGGIKIFNNSWIGNITGSSALRRMDHVMRRDDVLFVAGMNNSSTNLPLSSHMYNGITVGRMNGAHATSDTGTSFDGPGRQKPEIIASATNPETSYTTAVVSAGCALMVQTARTGPLDGDPDADRSEVIKAVILTGATHDAAWTNNAPMTGPQKGLTTRPLDDVDGAGILNVDRSHMILTGGQQDGAAAFTTAPNADHAGWSLDTLTRDQQRYWRFQVYETVDEVSILATWHRWVNNNNFALTTNGWAVADFNLKLWKVGETGALTDLVGNESLILYSEGNVASESAVDNLEHIYLRDLRPGEYVLELDRVDANALITTVDVAVAWLLPQTFCTGDTDGSGTIDVADFFALLQNWGNCADVDACPWDFAPTNPDGTRGDGIVDVPDFFALLQNWGPCE